MRLVTFENSLCQPRVGAITANGRIVDLNSAYALYLRELKHEAAAGRLADALVPANMRTLFEGGDTSLDAARQALDYVLAQKEHVVGTAGEPVLYGANEVKLRPPIIPRSFFILRAIFGSITKKPAKRVFRIP